MVINGIIYTSNVESLVEFNVSQIRKAKLNERVSCGKS